MTTKNRKLNPIAEQAALDFILADFGQCFEQLRYYDSQIVHLFKFMFVVYTFLTGLVTAFYQYFLEKQADLSTPAVVTLAVGLLLGFFLYAIILRNRIYFVRAARYINDQRAFFTAMHPAGFSSAAPMYPPGQPRHFNWSSSQSWMLYMVAFLNAMVLYAISLFQRGSSSTTGIVVAISAFCIQIAAAVLVLKSND